MLGQYFENIEKGQDIRQNLIDMRKELKTPAGLEELKKLPDDKIGLLIRCLSDEDAKARKNAALILGDLGRQECLDDLYTAYAGEEKLFVRSSYLTAMSRLDYRKYLPEFKDRMAQLTEAKAAEENEKHLNEELKVLRDMVLTIEGRKMHRFTGMHKLSDLVLVTSPGFEELTFNQLPARSRENARMVSGGVIVRTDDLGPLLEIRTMKGILFRFCKNPMPGTDYETVARTLVQSGLKRYVSERLEGKGPYYFRIDMKTKLVLDVKGQFIKRLSSKIEQYTDHQLQNSASSYEFEIRITENRKGQYSAYLKFNAMEDTRFDYRCHALGTSLHPVRAAETVALAGEYLMNDAQVLDPFCGTGTLLIERFKALRTKNIYGIDIFGEAVLKARENARLAHVQANFINRDFADFKHEYRFDEIITEPPALSEHMEADQLYGLYQIFVRRIPEWLNTDGIVIVLTTQENWLKKLAAQSGYLKEEAVYHLSGKRASAVMIMRYTG